ncbi:hypothetical protein BH11BAC5_BH11BAC5_40290 [soil metagenome]
MFIINSSRPEAGKISFQRLWFSKAVKRCGLNISDEFKDSKGEVLIAGFKQFLIINSIRRKLNLSHDG